jgi:hypothetical protein
MRKKKKFWFFDFRRLVEKPFVGEFWIMFAKIKILQQHFPEANDILPVEDG